MEVEMEAGGQGWWALLCELTNASLNAKLL